MMLSDIKKELLKSPETIADILESYGYANIKIRESYMSFGRDQNSSPKSIVIRLEENPYLYVHDYARNIDKDFFAYIMDQRRVDFKSVLETTKQHLGISDYYSHFEKKVVFGGFYDSISSSKSESPLKTYDQHILDPYLRVGNVRFLRDNISLHTQAFFDIRYDVENDGIVIPIYSQVGSICGVKERINREPREDEQKYWYVVPGRASKTLYGYSQNYKFLVENTVLIFEAEKSCMQCHSYGIRNCVALGSGSISRDQIKMMYELNPARVLFMHDALYEKDAILKNINQFKKYNPFSDVETGYWNWELSNIKDKVSPSDLGKRRLKYILQNEIEMIE